MKASADFITCRGFDLFDGLGNIIGVFCGEGLVRMLPVHRPQATIVH